jgi:hypothetical protein
MERASGTGRAVACQHLRLRRQKIELLCLGRTISTSCWAAHHSLTLIWQQAGQALVTGHCHRRAAEAWGDAVTRSC